MAFKSFLRLGDNVYKCVFTTVQFKPKLYAIDGHKQIRNFNKLRGRTKLTKSSFPNGFFKKQPDNSSPNVWKPFAFTVMFSGTTFIAAAIWEYERIRERTYRMIRNYKQWGIHKTGWRRNMEDWWSNLSEGEKLFIPICFLNVLVFLSWHVPVLRPTMYRYFCSSPAAGGCWSMLLLTFSHYSLPHLIVNMYVLYNFCTIGVKILGREQFLALYLTSGVVSSFSSHLYKTVIGVKEPSLGASGAIMGILGFICTQFPNMYLSIVFLPMLKFTASTAIKAMMGLDTVGCLLRWQRLDHAAHLGGALFGIFWQMWGNANIWQKREPVLVFWHQLREPPK